MSNIILAHYVNKFWTSDKKIDERINELFKKPHLLKEVEIRVEVTNLRTWYKILGNEIGD